LGESSSGTRSSNRALQIRTQLNLGDGLSCRPELE
jgi:hypothetical protein